MDVSLWQTRFRNYMEILRWSSRTVEGYVGELSRFFPWLETQGVDTLGGITREVLDAYQRHLFTSQHRGKPLTASTQMSRLNVVRAFTRFLVRENYLLVDPGDDMLLPRVPATLPRVLLSEEELVRVIEAPDTTEITGLRDRTILELFYATAIRNSELAALEVGDVHVERHEVYVRCGKGAKPRVVPMGDEATRWLDRYLQRGRSYLAFRPQENHLFLTYRGRPFNRAVLAKLVRKAAVRAGLTKTVTPHLLRHCCATHMLARGAGIRHLQELLGHATLASTQRYTQIEISDLKDIHRRCHPREQRRLS